jgi:hypothetical protein
MTGYPEMTEPWLGLCPKPPVLHATAAVLIGQPDTIHPATPDGSGPAGRSGRIRDGIGIAAASLRALIRDRQLLWFALLSGLVMLFLILAQGWNIIHAGMTPSFPVDIPVLGSSVYLNLQMFLMELVCLSGFVLVLAGLVLYRNGKRGAAAAGTPYEVWAVIRASFRPLAALSAGMSLIAILACDGISHSRFFGSIVHDMTMALFWLPYQYYNPGGVFSVLYASANIFALKIMAINSLLFLAALYLVPLIVLEKKGLLFALAGSVPLFRRTWREVLGCILVFGSIVLAVVAVGLAIGQSPALLGHDYDFFISASRGYLPMMVVCYGFIVACWALMAAGFSAAGVAVADLYHTGKSRRIPGLPERGLNTTEPAS